MEWRKRTWPSKFSITEPIMGNLHTGYRAPLTANPRFSNRPKKTPFAHAFLIDPDDD
jgi:hypothetical protein